MYNLIGDTWFIVPGTHNIKNLPEHFNIWPSLGRLRPGADENGNIEVVQPIIVETLNVSSKSKLRFELVKGDSIGTIVDKFGNKVNIVIPDRKYYYKFMNRKNEQCTLELSYINAKLLFDHLGSEFKCDTPHGLKFTKVELNKWLASRSKHDYDNQNEFVTSAINKDFEILMQKGTNSGNHTYWCLNTVWNEIEAQTANIFTAHPMYRSNPGIPHYWTKSIDSNHIMVPCGYKLTFDLDTRDIINWPPFGQSASVIPSCGHSTELGWCKAVKGKFVCLLCVMNNYVYSPTTEKNDEWINNCDHHENAALIYPREPTYERAGNWDFKIEDNNPQMHSMNGTCMEGKSAVILRLNRHTEFFNWPIIGYLNVSGPLFNPKGEKCWDLINIYTQQPDRLKCIRISTYPKLDGTNLQLWYEKQLYSGSEDCLNELWTDDRIAYTFSHKTYEDGEIISNIYVTDDLDYYSALGNDLPNYGTNLYRLKLISIGGLIHQHNLCLTVKAHEVEVLKRLDYIVTDTYNIEIVNYDDDQSQMTKEPNENQQIAHTGEVKEPSNEELRDAAIKIQLHSLSKLPIKKKQKKTRTNQLARYNDKDNCVVKIQEFIDNIKREISKAAVTNDGYNWIHACNALSGYKRRNEIELYLESIYYMLKDYMDINSYCILKVELDKHTHTLSIIFEDDLGKIIYNNTLDNLTKKCLTLNLLCTCLKTIKTNSRKVIINLYRKWICSLLLRDSPEVITKTQSLLKVLYYSTFCLSNDIETFLDNSIECQSLLLVYPKFIRFESENNELKLVNDSEYQCPAIITTIDNKTMLEDSSQITTSVEDLWKDFKTRITEQQSYWKFGRQWRAFKHLELLTTKDYILFSKQDVIINDKILQPPLGAGRSNKERFNYEVLTHIWRSNAHIKVCYSIPYGTKNAEEEFNSTKGLYLHNVRKCPMWILRDMLTLDNFVGDNVEIINNMEKHDAFDLVTMVQWFFEGNDVVVMRHYEATHNIIRFSDDYSHITPGSVDKMTTKPLTGSYQWLQKTGIKQGYYCRDVARCIETAEIISGIPNPTIILDPRSTDNNGLYILSNHVFNSTWNANTSPGGILMSAINTRTGIKGRDVNMIIPQLTSIVVLTNTSNLDNDIKSFNKVSHGLLYEQARASGESLKPHEMVHCKLSEHITGANEAETQLLKEKFLLVAVHPIVLFHDECEYAIQDNRLWTETNKVRRSTKF